MNPNSQHQVWSEWEFTIHEFARFPSFQEVAYNFAKWARKGFGSAGEVQIRRILSGWELKMRIEGLPVQDKSFISHVRKAFVEDFVRKGWGDLAAFGKVKARLLAGYTENNKPAHQWLELPHLILSEGTKCLSLRTV
jgi:hypothetical protein